MSCCDNTSNYYNYYTKFSIVTEVARESESFGLSSQVIQNNVCYKQVESLSYPSILMKENLKKNKAKQSKQMLYNLPLQGNTNLFGSSCTIANPLMLALAS